MQQDIRNVLAYDRQHHAPAPVASKVKIEREEMWWLTLAKSKTMRFFSVSCEFIIFIGCLWLTLVTILPDAAGWLNGGIDSFFLVAMGFAVDAALPEAWLHVVDQYISTPRKKSQLRWSIPIAIGMLLLVVANIVYTKLAGTSGATPTGAMEGLVNTLLIARMFLGISYVTIRECQSFIDRKQVKQQAAQPTAPDIQKVIDQALAGQQAKVEQRLAGISTNLQQLQNAPATVPQIDIEPIVSAVVAQFETRFTTAMKRLEQRVSVSLAAETGQSGTAATGPKLVPLPQRSIPPARVKRSQVERETAPAGQGETGEAGDCKSAVYAHLDRDHTLQVADLTRLTGYPKTTVWRHWNRYHEDHGTRGTGPIVEGNVEQQAESETA